MAWSDAARRAALEARRRNSKTRLRGQVRTARDYTVSTRTQLRSIQSLARRGRSPLTGRRVGRKAARRIAARIGDWAND